MFSILPILTNLLSVVLVMIQGTSRNCELHCRDPTNRDYPYAIPGCICFHQTNKPVSDSVQLNKLAPDGADIPVKELIGKEKYMLDLPQIYYILNPKKIDITITNKKKGHISDNPKTRMELLVQQDIPLYLDIGLQENSNTKSGKMKELQLSEDRLSDCLDLNILIYSRKNNSSTTTKPVFNKVMLKKYENMSDTDLILAIKSKCSQPLNIVMKSLTDVRDRQPRKEYKNKSLLQSTAFHLNAPSAKGVPSSLLPTLTNRQDYEEQMEEDTDATDISPSYVDVLDESDNKEQLSENTNSEGSDTYLDNDSSAQFPYSGLEIFKNDEHDNNLKNNFHGPTEKVVEVTDKNMNISLSEYVHTDLEQNSQYSDLKKNNEIANKFANNEPSAYNEDSRFDLKNKGIKNIYMINSNEIPHGGSLLTSNYDKELSPNINVKSSKTEDAAGGLFAHSSELQNISNKKEDSDLDTTIPLLKTSETQEYVNSVTTHSPKSITDVNELVSNSFISPNMTSPLNGSGIIHDSMKSGNSKTHYIQDQTEDINNSATSDINKKTSPNIGNYLLDNMLNASLGRLGFDDNKTDVANFAKYHFNVTNGRSGDESLELFNKYSKPLLLSNKSEEILVFNTIPIDTTTGSEGVDTIVVTKANTISPGLKSGSQKNTDKEQINTVTKPHEQYSEYEIKIPKIISTELKNGTVDSHVDGYEVPPKHDFIPDENIGAAAEVQLKKREKQSESEISGHIYFVFGKVAIPAKFIQNARGKVRLGLDGFSLCRLWLIDHPQTDFFAKQCKSRKEKE